ncbi:MAG: hypothetical protein UY98_C0032G0008 [Candidatus Kaiserbacteria bacterium GW2011_GWA2_58_9]|uniref:CARDB domain-containing protein n=1 Tax=Candidatus Kaiserbacteria bacterium GW2011_GWA2_58_9 TaxID=1618672 RepID=A0A0G2AX95_9BACT|nr:MAG: hypothetical protein UY98_C0032G0008 [Candidatus Kaiserbacteria bacterium GW2011_GWA2_58_9]
MRRFIILLLLLPAVSLAAEIQAGFPSQAIWASKSAAVEGETLVISAVVYNGNAAPLKGTLVFSADGARIGAREFELPEGKSQIHSIEWKPRAGEYRLAAAIEGTSAPLSQRETSSIVSVFEAIEPARKAGVERLENYLEGARASSGSGAAGSSAPDAAGFASSGGEGEVAGKGGNLASNAAQTAAAAALFVMDSLYLFYPLLALLVLGTLYFLARRIRRPG